MLRCESKLDGEPTYCVFPSNYIVYGKDRNSASEGVFIAIKDTFASYPLYDADTNCEIVWASYQLNGCKKLILASYYRLTGVTPQNVIIAAKCNINAKCNNNRRKM